MKNRGTPKLINYWVATNLTENLFNKITLKKHVFRATRVGVSCVNIVGHVLRGVIKKKMVIKWGGGVTKSVSRYFRKFMTPIFQRKW